MCVEEKAATLGLSSFKYLFHASVNTFFPPFFLYRYGSLVESMKKRFAKKRERKSLNNEEEDVSHNIMETQPKKAFLKPRD